MSDSEPKPTGLQAEAIETIRFITEHQLRAFETSNTFWGFKDEDGYILPPLEAPEVLDKLSQAPTMLDKFGVFFEHIDIMRSYTLAHIDHADDASALRVGKDAFADMLHWLKEAELVDGELPRDGNRSLMLRKVDGVYVCTRQRTLVQLTSEELPDLSRHNITSLEIKKRMQFILDIDAIEGLDTFVKASPSSAVMDVPPIYIEYIESLLDDADRKIITPISTTYYAAVDRKGNGNCDDAAN